MAITNIPASESVATLAVIDLEKLLQGDPGTAEELLRASESPGFFYVKLGGPSTSAMPGDLEAIFGVARDYFAQPLETKNAQFRSGIDRGYKPGKCHETFEFATSELRDGSDVFPKLMGKHEALVKRLTEQSDKVTKIILKSLLGSIGAPELEPALTANEGDSGFKFISCPTSERRQDHPDTVHTDDGVVTLLWCPQLSSQIQDSASKEWQWVKPTEGCAIANVANALQKFTGGRLHSCVHRVLQPGDGAEERMMLSYYLRPSTA